MKTTRLRLLLPLFALLLATTQRAAAQGPITPPSAPTVPIMKSLDQVEPRTPIPGGSSTYTITAPGSYYLTGNIAVTTANSGLIVNASKVTIDLCGYTISTNPAFNAACVILSQPNIVLRNGILSGGNVGVSFPSSSTPLCDRIESLNINGCATYGINASANTTGVFISHCVVANIGSSSMTVTTAGIVAEGGCIVEDCLVDTVTTGGTSKTYGILLGAGSFASGNRIRNCYYGVAFGKSQNNLTFGCTTAFQNSIDAGGNN